MGFGYAEFWLLGARVFDCGRHVKDTDPSDQRHVSLEWNMVGVGEQAAVFCF